MCRRTLVALVMGAVFAATGCARGPRHLSFLGKPREALGASRTARETALPAPGPVYPGELRPHGVPAPGLATVRDGVLLSAPPGGFETVRPVALEVWPVAGVVATEGGSVEDSAAFYYGADVGARWPSGWSIAGAYRTHALTNQGRGAYIPPALPPDDAVCQAFPEDGLCQGLWLAETREGRLHRVGVRTTYAPPVHRHGRRLSWYVGGGPEVVRSTGFRNADTSLGVGTEAGLVLRLSDHVQLRGGVAIHGTSLDLDGSGSEWMWTYGASVGIGWSP